MNLPWKNHNISDLQKMLNAVSDKPEFKKIQIEIQHKINQIQRERSIDKNKKEVMLKQSFKEKLKEYKHNEISLLYEMLKDESISISNTKVRLIRKRIKHLKNTCSNGKQNIRALTHKIRRLEHLEWIKYKSQKKKQNGDN